nr:MAG TPA: hypothetical protein [Caudoviricetes sp.]
MYAIRQRHVFIVTAIGELTSIILYSIIGVLKNLMFLHWLLLDWNIEQVRILAM